MESYTLEELDQLITLKLGIYLEMKPIMKNTDDKMMYFEEKLAAEKDLFYSMRRINYLLDILVR